MPNAKFLLTLGMMGGGQVITDVKAVADSYGETGGVYFKQTTARASGGHPSVEVHMEAGKELTEFIRQNILK